MYKVIIFTLILAVFTASETPILAQNEACDTENLSSELTEYTEAIAGASYDEVEAISIEIDALLKGYLEDCSEETTSESTSEEIFNVKATGNANIRSCGNTTCDVVAVSTQGQTYAVVGIEEDWYEIDLGNGETGFIASWLTVRGPDEIIDLYEGYTDLDVFCVMVAAVSRGGSSSLDFAISGSGQDAITVDIIRPNTTNPEPVWRQIPKTFVDTGDLYIHQIYRSTYWPSGSYQISLERDDNLKVYEFELEQTGDTTIHILCE